jgi:hypothetical protein
MRTLEQFYKQVQPLKADAPESAKEETRIPNPPSLEWNDPQYSEEQNKLWKELHIVEYNFNDFVLLMQHLCQVVYASEFAKIEWNGVVEENHVKVNIVSAAPCNKTLVAFKMQIDDLTVSFTAKYIYYTYFSQFLYETFHRMVFIDSRNQMCRRFKKLMNRHLARLFSEIAEAYFISSECANYGKTLQFGEYLFSFGSMKNNFEVFIGKQSENDIYHIPGSDSLGEIWDKAYIYIKGI